MYRQYTTHAWANYSPTTRHTPPSSAMPHAFMPFQAQGVMPPVSSYPPREQVYPARSQSKTYPRVRNHTGHIDAIQARTQYRQAEARKALHETSTKRPEAHWRYVGTIILESMLIVLLLSASLTGAYGLVYATGISALPHPSQFLEPVVQFVTGLIV